MHLEEGEDRKWMRKCDPDEDMTHGIAVEHMHRYVIQMFRYIAILADHHGLKSVNEDNQRMIVKRESRCRNNILQLFPLQERYIKTYLIHHRCLHLVVYFSPYLACHLAVLERTWPWND